MKNFADISSRLMALAKVLGQPCTMSVTSDEALRAIIDRIYECVERPELWPETICAIGDRAGGRRSFWSGDHSVHCPHLSPGQNDRWIEANCQATFFLSRADLQVLEQYEQEFGKLIIRFLKIVFLSTLSSQTDISVREAIGFRMAQRYLDAFEPLGTSSEALASGRARRNLLAALWEDGRGFSSDNLHCMRALVPHLDRALRLQMRLISADVRADLVSGALDSLTLGVIFIDRSGLPLWLNSRAQEIVRRSNVLQLSSAGLTARRQSDAHSVRKLVNGALTAGTQDLLAISRDADELRPLLLIAVPLKPISIQQTSERAAYGVVFISDPDRTDSPTVESLRRAFKLTNREAQMAIAVAHGHGLQAAADMMGVALTTARTQLQQAFAKTGTRHQAELAALVHRTLTQIRHN
jgi:DNA-binding CsgD family transcriptional regulator/PAS domain-containing protein